MRTLLDQYAEAYPILVRFCAGYRVPNESPTSLAQAVYFKAVLSNRYKPGMCATTWLYVIAKRHIVDQFRKASNRLKESLDQPIGNQTEDGLTLADIIPESVSSCPQILAQRLRIQEDVSHALAQLPATMRAVVQLVDLGGLGYRQAALELNVEEGTIRSRVSRARQKLRLLLASYQ